MLQNNPLLAQLKQQLKETLPTKEGIVRATAKSYGFLEISDKESVFIAPPQMKKVLHGDRIRAVIRTEGEKSQAEPEALLESAISSFVGQIKRQKSKLSVEAANPLLRDAFKATVAEGINAAELQNGDWVIATLSQHALSAESFIVTITELVAKADDPEAPWWVVLARHELPKRAPEALQQWPLLDTQPRTDFTTIPFLTIDNASTQDMDDAISVRAEADGWQLQVAVADPDAYIAAGSALDQQAQQRAFTTYLPGRNIPMLPRELADDLCSLQQGVKRPAIVATMHITTDGALQSPAEFTLAWICSQARLNYQQVSDFLEQQGDWQPDNSDMAEQLQQLQLLTQARQQWRQQHAIVFQDKPDYRFELDEAGQVVHIHAEHRRIANQMVEEAMIAANQACGDLLANRLGFGLFNVHQGFDSNKLSALAELLQQHAAPVAHEELAELSGYCQLRRWLTQQDTRYLESRLRRFQAYAGMSITPAPHFGMGLTQYATWTSPIRKYGDLVNQRLLKAILQQQPAPEIPEQLTQHLADQRKVQRKAERDIADWLYHLYLQPQLGATQAFTAEIFDINRAGIRVRLLENGAAAFIPASLIAQGSETVKLNWEEGRCYLAEQALYELGQQLQVQLHELNEPGNILVKPLQSAE
ncbi:exoribonuclease II [Alishewanella sp. HL-SH05]|uniref:exoribonuclease II n=1 Tax=Alishewanella sp. HL-SH05 TaxID=3461145 RepID=UPI004041E72A